MANSKKNVFLDLDNTLICSEPLDSFDEKKHKRKAEEFNFHNMDNYYIVFERPGVQEFLDYLFENFNVSVWTAATQSYALFVIDNVILSQKGRHLEYVLFSYHCDWSEKRKRGIKGLDFLYEIVQLPGITKENTVIIDDLKEVSKINGENCISIKPFEFTERNSQNDNELQNVKNKLEIFKNK